MKHKKKYQKNKIIKMNQKQKYQKKKIIKMNQKKKYQKKKIIKMNQKQKHQKKKLQINIKKKKLKIVYNIMIQLYYLNHFINYQEMDGKFIGKTKIQKKNIMKLQKRRVQQSE